MSGYSCPRPQGHLAACDLRFWGKTSRRPDSGPGHPAAAAARTGGPGVAGAGNHAPKKGDPAPGRVAGGNLTRQPQRARRLAVLRLPLPGADLFVTEEACRNYAAAACTFMEGIAHYFEEAGTRWFPVR